MHKKEHLELLCDAGEMFALLAGDSETEDILQRCVQLVAVHLKAEVCSIYLLETASQTLVLRATKGLSPDAVGVLTLKVGEGLVGKAMENRRQILEDHASRNPDFKYFPASGEAAFECFLALPILRGPKGIGVLVVQRRAHHPFSQDESMVLRSIASQLAVLIENARLLLGVKAARAEASPGTPAVQADPAAGLPRIIPARPASRGVVMGEAIQARKNPILEMLRRNAPVSHLPQGDTRDLEQAIAKTISQIETLEREVSRRLPEAVTLIFDAHIMILKDKGFSVKMVEMTRQGSSALEAVVTVARRYMDLFGAAEDSYLQEKVADVEDVATRLIENLVRSHQPPVGDHQAKILIARDLLPSEAVGFAMKGVAGFILIGGGVASHAAILARSLDIPMVITENRDLLTLSGATPMILDARVGNIYCRPDDKTRAEFQAQMTTPRTSRKIPEKETVTRDGAPVSLMVNINLLAELDGAMALNARGVGLYRSEFPYLVRNNFPSQGEQLRVYHTLFTKMAGREVTVRTLDVGGDKMLSYFDNAGEANPELGLRSIRFSFQYPDILEQQLKALLKAAAATDPPPRLRIMFPMVSSLDEFRRARRILEECHQAVELAVHAKGTRENSRSVPLPAIGMMLELPSVVEIMPELAAEADFFSIGTNDFVQYMLAADRTNDRVAPYYIPHHPGVLRALNRMAAAVIAAGKDLSVCGEMANNPSFIPFFLGIGIRKLSVNQNYLYKVQQCIKQWTLADARDYAVSLLSRTGVEEVEALLASGA